MQPFINVTLIPILRTLRKTATVSVRIVMKRPAARPRDKKRTCVEDVADFYFGGQRDGQMLASIPYS